MTGRPTWAAGTAAATPTRAPVHERPPATLAAAALLAVVLAVAEAVHVAGRDDLRTGLRVALVAGIALQVPCAVLLLRRSSTAAMVLLLCAVRVFVGAIASGSLLAAVGAAVLLVLLALSLRWFPTAEPWSS